MNRTSAAGTAGLAASLDIADEYARLRMADDLPETAAREAFSPGSGARAEMPGAAVVSSAGGGRGLAAVAEPAQGFRARPACPATSSSVPGRLSRAPIDPPRFAAAMRPVTVVGVTGHAGALQKTRAGGRFIPVVPAAPVYTVQSALADHRSGC